MNGPKQSAGERIKSLVPAVVHQRFEKQQQQQREFSAGNGSATLILADVEIEAIKRQMGKDPMNWVIATINYLETVDRRQDELEARIKALETMGHRIQ